MVARANTKIPSTLLRDNFADVADATMRGERFVVTRNGKARLAIVPLEDLAILRSLEDGADRRVAKKRAREGVVSWETLKAELGLK